jgi:hypothetical protein
MFRGIDATRVGRRAMIAGVAAAVAGLGPLARLARAATTKEKILQGCKDSGNSAIDKPDGSYQCNLRDGGEIRCDTKDQCIYVPPRKIASQPGGVVDVGGLLDAVGGFDLVADGAAGADPLVPVGSLLELPGLGITVVVAAPGSGRPRRKRRR